MLRKQRAMPSVQPLCWAWGCLNEQLNSTVLKTFFFWTLNCSHWRFATLILVLCGLFEMHISLKNGFLQFLVPYPRSEWMIAAWESQRSLWGWDATLGGGTGKGYLGHMAGWLCLSRMEQPSRQLTPHSWTGSEKQWLITRLGIKI